MMSAPSRRSRTNMASTVRYHLTTPKRRTTISMDKIISDLMVLKLGLEPQAPEAHSAVRTKLEELLQPYFDPQSPYYDPGRYFKPTQFVTKYALLWLVGARLSERYNQSKAGGG